MSFIENELQSVRKILVFPFDLLAHYLRSMELVKHFPNAEIVFAESKSYNDFIKRQGFTTFKVLQFDTDYVMKCSRKFDFSWLNYNDIKTVYDDQVRVIKNEQPDLVFGDIAPTLKMASEKCKISYLALNNAYLSPYYKYVRKLSIRHKIYPLFKFLPHQITDKMTEMGENFTFRTIHRSFRRLRQKESLQRFSSYLEEMQGDYNLLCDSEALFPQVNLPENYEIIGPLNHKVGSKEEDLLSKLNPNLKTIVICMGSSGDWDFWDFIEENDLYNYNIITAGSDRSYTPEYLLTWMQFLKKLIYLFVMVETAPFTRASVQMFQSFVEPVILNRNGMCMV